MKKLYVMAIAGGVACIVLMLPDIIPDWIPLFGLWDNLMRLLLALGILVIAWLWL